MVFEMRSPDAQQRIIIGISGASGVVLGIRMLQVLQTMPVETHLVFSPSAEETLLQETDWQLPDVLSLADAVYSYTDVGAEIASGSFSTDGMIVIPCSIKSLSSIANAYNADLLTRAADVTLKEGRRLILVVREAPLHLGHIRLMERAAEIGAIIFPPVPAFYARPFTIDDIVDNIVGRILMRFGIQNDIFLEWKDKLS
jgi:4-hydroxy-3-polyprenylbenzoate decarboxylase